MCNPIMKDTYLATTQLHCLSSKLRHHQLLLNRMNCMYVLVVFLKPRQIYGLFQSFPDRRTNFYEIHYICRLLCVKEIDYGTFC